MKKALEEKLRALVLAESEKESRREWINVGEAAEELFNYRFDHVNQVVEISERLAKLVGADKEVVVLAAWLHDIAKPGIADTSKHGEKGAQRAREILMAENARQEVIEAACDAIEKHVGLTLEEKIEPIEAQVIWDADKLTKLGIVGMVHFLVNGIKVDPVKTIEEVEKKVRKFLPLARKIASSMNTEPGKEEAERRLAHLEAFAEDLRTELNMDGLVN